MAEGTKNIKSLIGYVFIGILAASTIIPILGILLLITVKGIGRVDFMFLFETSTSMETGGIFAPIFGTIILTMVTMLIAVPIGILSAIYMSEYARKGRLFHFIEMTIINLAGVPSVVYGLFGLGIFVLLLNIGVSILAGALTMGVLILPLIITVSYQALRTVPDSLREASLALGATRLQTVFRVILPASTPGILTGIILATARVAGETAPVLFTAAAYYLPSLPSTVYDKTMLLSYHLYAISTQVTGVSEEQKYGVTFVLIFLVLGLNGLAIFIRSKISKKLGALN
ncbi:MAG: phosphate ABC transporter permease PstA [Leptospirales bacterium]